MVLLMSRRFFFLLTTVQTRAYIIQVRDYYTEQTTMTEHNREDSSTLITGNTRRKFSSIVVFDTEASCLPSPGKIPKITELCLLSFLTDEIITQERLPRVINKLQLCFNPKKPIDPSASRITGLFNDVLEQMPSFQDQAALITSFLSSQPSPTCLIAHNGHSFDFPLLMAELKIAVHSLPEKPLIYCADSLEAFRMLDGLSAKPEWLMKKEARNKQRSFVGTEDKSSPNAAGNQGENEQASRVCSQSSMSDGKIQEEGEKVLNKDVERSLLSKESDLSGCQWSQHEKTPNRATRTSEYPSRDLAKQLRKRHIELSDEELQIKDSKVVRRLFDEFKGNEENKSEKASTMKTEHSSSEGSPLEHNSSVFRSNLETQSNRESKPQSLQEEDFWHGSISDEEFGILALKAEAAHEEEQRITSLGSESNKKGELSTEQSITIGEKGYTADNDKSQLASSLTSKDEITQQPGLQKIRRKRNLFPVMLGSLSYKLGEIYWREFHESPQGAHSAEGDCLTLLKLIHKKGSEFISWVEENAVLLSTTHPMS